MEIVSFWLCGLCEDRRDLSQFVTVFYGYWEDGVGKYLSIKGGRRVLRGG